MVEALGPECLNIFWNRAWGREIWQHLLSVRFLQWFFGGLLGSRRGWELKVFICGSRSLGYEPAAIVVNGDIRGFRISGRSAEQLQLKRF